MLHWTRAKHAVLPPLASNIWRPHFWAKIVTANDISVDSYANVDTSTP